MPTRGNLTLENPFEKFKSRTKLNQYKASFEIENERIEQLYNEKGNLIKCSASSFCCWISTEMKQKSQEIWNASPNKTGSFISDSLSESISIFKKILLICHFWRIILIFFTSISELCCLINKYEHRNENKTGLHLVMIRI